MPRLLHFATLLLFSLALAGCGLFRSSSAPPPSGPTGSIELSLIDRSTLKPAPAKLHWKVRGHPSNGDGEKVVYDGNSSRPRLQLAQGWYLVAVEHDQGVTTHIFEIYPGVHQDMHLIRMAM